MVDVYKSSTIDSVPASQYVPTADHRVLMSGVSWAAFEAILAARGDAAGPRVTYLEGDLELMSPSRDHESIKKRFAAVIEAFLDELGIEWDGVGAWLLKDRPRRAGLEPDECYVLHDLRKKRPDLALQVVWTSGGIDKLEIYRRLGVGEVWFWEKNRIAVYVLAPRGYHRRTASRCLPGFDFALVSQMMKLPSLRAVRQALRRSLRG